MVIGKKNPSDVLKRENKHVRSTSAQREEMIRLAAYYRAEKNRFAGSPLQFWYEAEKEIDGRSKDGPGHSRRK